MIIGIKVSKMTGKLKGIDAINTNPLSNGYCKKMSKCKNTICSQCYSIRMLKTIRRLCIKSWELNSKLLSKEKLPNYLLPRFTRGSLIRFSAHGELINEIHLKNYENIIKMNPDCYFALWTKRADLLKGRKKLKNCIYVYSSPIINKVSTVSGFKFDKIFTTFYKEYVEANKIKINCHGKKCIKCKLCYKPNKTIYINELIKGHYGKLSKQV